MTAKIKAKELIDKYDIGEIQNTFFQKTCALICVDEIIKSTFSKKTYEKWEIITCDSLTTEYWEEVKQEIEKL